MFFKRPISPVAKPVAQLPKLTTPNAADLASKFKPQPEARALLKPNQTSSEYVHALEQNQQSTDAVKALAHGMPERESVGWACQSSEKVADKLDPADKSALEAAQAWVKEPTEGNKAAAAAAAEKTNHQGPGAWAAQGAAWSQNPKAAAGVQNTTSTAPQPAGLTGHAVAGSVMLAAAIAAGKMPAPKPPTAPDFQAPQMPALQTPQLATPPMTAPNSPTPMSMAERTEIAKVHQPFIDLGKAIASGQKSVA